MQIIFNDPALLLVVLATISLPHQCTAKESSENVTMLCSTARLFLPEAPELGTPRYKGQNLGSNGVRYREVPLYTYARIYTQNVCQGSYGGDTVHVCTLHDFSYRKFMHGLINHCRKFS